MDARVKPAHDEVNEYQSVAGVPMKSRLPSSIPQWRRMS
jgi:hypothetical protein